MNGVVNVQPEQRPNKLVKLLLIRLAIMWLTVSFVHYNGSQPAVVMKCKHDVMSKKKHGRQRNI